MRHTSHWDRTRYLYTCVQDSATCVVGYMRGWLHVYRIQLHVWLATCVQDSATCVVGYMRGWLHVWLRSPYLACMNEELGSVDKTEWTR